MIYTVVYFAKINNDRYYMVKPETIGFAKKLIVTNINTSIHNYIQKSLIFFAIIRMNARTKTHTAQRKLSGKSYQTLVSRQKTLERITPLLAISEPPPLLYTSSHISFLRKALQGLPPFVTPVDSTKPWFLFWTLRSLEALNSLSTLTPDISSKVVKYFEALKCPATGAYGGSSAYMPHAATTYAGVCALLTLGTDEAYRSIDRARLYGFFMGLKNADGSFRVHEGGESDVRGAYTVLATATLLGILTEELGRGVAEWIKE